MVFLAYVVCFWYVCTGPPFLAHLKNLGGGDTIWSKIFSVCSGPPCFFGSGPPNGGKRSINETK